MQKLIPSIITGALFALSSHASVTLNFNSDLQGFGGGGNGGTFGWSSVNGGCMVNCGGIAEKSAITMQIYADVTGRPMKVSRSAQTCALGSAIAAAVVAGAHKDYTTAQKQMTGLKPKVYRPNPKAHEIYRELYPLYRTLHDAFGTREWSGNLFDVMKQLIEIRGKVRK